MVLLSEKKTPTKLKFVERSGIKTEIAYADVFFFHVRLRIYFSSGINEGSAKRNYHANFDSVLMIDHLLPRHLYFFTNNKCA